MVLLTVILTGLIVVILSSLFINWYYEVIEWGGGDAYISFNRFIKLYKIDPNKWVLYDSDVTVKGTTFWFGPIGYYMYKLWRHQVKKQEAYKELNEIFGGKNENS